MKGWVYFLQAEGLDLIKIGWTTRGLAQRYGELDQVSPVPLSLLGCIACELGTEKRLHAEFRESWHRGEWFRADHRLLDYIAKNVKPWNDFCNSQKRDDPTGRPCLPISATNTTTRCDRCRRVIWSGVDRFVVEHEDEVCEVVCTDCKPN